MAAAAAAAAVAVGVPSNGAAATGTGRPCQADSAGRRRLPCCGGCRTYVGWGRSTHTHTPFPDLPSPSGLCLLLTPLPPRVPVGRRVGPARLTVPLRWPSRCPAVVPARAAARGASVGGEGGGMGRTTAFQ
ncbi:hypothetical protein I4F81_002217 [Pyropia yezoensis]|uniref:Uncharacterized protein n=1 Tax=Pyropia yezoensis TaxID=2788 RepID=A0ACC3BPW1_PYRYE|nr:hypothetical protein I4F81_002217 [Neopyropia yezoensis]